MVSNLLGGLEDGISEGLPNLGIKIISDIFHWIGKLLLITFNRDFSFGLVIWQPYNWCLAFRLPIMKYWPRELKKFSNYVCVILCVGGQYVSTTVIGTWFSLMFIAVTWNKSSFILG